MYFDRFDIVEAYYLFYSNYHTGQNSYEYERLSAMCKYFTPSPFLNEDNLTENSLEIYTNLVNKIKVGV